MDGDARGSRGTGGRTQNRADEPRHPEAAWHQNKPDYGNLWESSHYKTVNNRAEVPATNHLQPHMEGGVAFLIGRPLHGTHITPQEVLAATDVMAMVVNIVASWIADWRINLGDTIADNAS